MFIGGFALIAGGMFLSSPDRTIPPFSIGGQEGSVVAVHVPSWTSDPDIATLIRRFRDIGAATRDFRSMKVRPTTSGDPDALYQKVVLYIFSAPGWTEPDTLHRYLAGHDGEGEEAFRRKFQRAARGGFLYNRGAAKGWLGPIPGRAQPWHDPAIQVLFDDSTTTVREPLQPWNALRDSTHRDARQNF